MDKKMGTDCYFYDGENYCSLDRWYVFSDAFESAKAYSTGEIFRGASELKKKISETSDAEWWDMHLSDKGYYEHWIEEVLKLAARSKSDRFIFFLDSDMPGEFYKRVVSKLVNKEG